MKCTTILGICLTLALASCATPPSVGVRPDFEGTKLTLVALPTTYSTATFGLRAYERRAIERAYELAATQWLVHRGIEVVNAGALNNHLKSREAQQSFQDGLKMRKSLTHYFEKDSQEQKAQLVRDLWNNGALPTRALLFTEVVYQSEGHCQETKIAGPHHVVVGDTAPEQPCIISHFQAKLVDAQTGATMWHNRSLIERRAQIDTEARARTIQQAIHQTFSGPFGLAPLLVSRQDSTR